MFSLFPPISIQNSNFPDYMVQCRVSRISNLNPAIHLLFFPSGARSSLVSRGAILSRRLTMTRARDKGLICGFSFFSLEAIYMLISVVTRTRRERKKKGPLTRWSIWFGNDDFFLLWGRMRVCCDSTTGVNQKTQSTPV